MDSHRWPNPHLQQECWARRLVLKCLHCYFKSGKPDSIWVQTAASWKLFLRWFNHRFIQLLLQTVCRLFAELSFNQQLIKCFLKYLVSNISRCFVSNMIPCSDQSVSIIWRVYVWHEQTLTCNHQNWPHFLISPDVSLCATAVSGRYTRKQQHVSFIFLKKSNTCCSYCQFIRCTRNNPWC